MSKTIQIKHLLEYKQQGKKLTCLTAYDYRIAELIDQAGIELILVGDSLSNVIFGNKYTQSIGMQEILHHTKAVCNGVKNSLVIADMPFGSYQASYEQAINNACELIKIGAKAIKLEGASEYHYELIRKLNIHGMPVIGHLGYTPQLSHSIGYGHKQGKTSEQAQEILQQAINLEKAGVKAIVLELIPAELAQEITETVKIPTIGIGAGENCDGQVLVSSDLLGMFEHKFSFVKQYANLKDIIKEAFVNYKDDIQN